MNFRSADVRSEHLRKIAQSTLATLKKKEYTISGISYTVQSDQSCNNTSYHSPNSLSSWSLTPPSAVPTTSPVAQLELQVLEISTLDGARLLAGFRHNVSSTNSSIGILNFASATKPGGGFMNGAQAQEESLARSSTLHPTLRTKTAQQFYSLHNRNKRDGYYSHAMIYSPRVVFFRDDDGGWIAPLEVDVLTSAAVNAGMVRKSLRGMLGGKLEEERIAAEMQQRMGRILYLFEKNGVRDIVLGSFGTGVFKNHIDMVARIWADLLTTDGARFATSFDHVVFAVLGRQTFLDFKTAFNVRVAENKADSCFLV